MAAGAATSSFRLNAYNAAPAAKNAHPHHQVMATSKVPAASPYITHETAALLKGRSTRNQAQSSTTLFSIKNVHTQPTNGNGTVSKQQHLRKKPKVPRASARNDAVAMGHLAAHKNVLAAAGKSMISN